MTAAEPAPDLFDDEFDDESVRTDPCGTTIGERTLDDLAAHCAAASTLSADETGALDPSFWRAWLAIMRAFPAVLEAARLGLPLHRELNDRASAASRAHVEWLASGHAKAAPGAIPQPADQEAPQ